MYSNFFKRIFDFTFSLIGLIISAPIMLIVILLLFIEHQGKPFFLQVRPGIHEKPFTVFKLKTMNEKKDQEGNLLPDSHRITKWGEFLRKSSLDEIPQLLNVLLGQMSLIGPRPLLVRYSPFYTDRERKRFLVRPGITGLAQVSGRNFISWDEKFEKDAYYVENLSLPLDFKIFIKTITKVLSSDGVEVNQDKNPTTVAFDIYRKNQNKMNKNFSK